MILTNKLKFIWGLNLLTALLITACSSDKTITESNDELLTTLSELASDYPCNSNIKGTTVYVESEDAAYVCEEDSIKKGEYRWVLKDVNYTYFDYYGSTQDRAHDSVGTSSSSDSPIIIQLSSSSARINLNESSFRDSRDGRIYRTIVIGGQTWMAENLNYATARSKCYNDSAVYCEKFGRMYTWADAIDSVGLANDENYPIVCGKGKECGLAHDLIRGIKRNGSVQGVCPEGWRLPAKADFYLLNQMVPDGSSLASEDIWTGPRIMVTSSRGAKIFTRVFKGTNSSGFSAQPIETAYYSEKGSGTQGVSAVFFWSSSEEGDATAYTLSFVTDSSGINVFFFDMGKGGAHYVRCIKGEAFGRPTVAEPLVDSRDGQVYKAVVIGEQTWMAENLNYNAQGSLCYGEYYPGYFAEKGATTCGPTGRYYSWLTAVGMADSMKNRVFELPETVQGVCPKGWHVPSKKEFEILLESVGGSDKAGAMLKSLDGWTGSEYKENEHVDHMGTWYDVPGNGISDAYGFNALPGGLKDYSMTTSSGIRVNGVMYYDQFSSYGGLAYFHSSTQYSTQYQKNSAYYLILAAGTSSLIDGESAQIKSVGNHAINIRCVKDGGNYVVGSSSSVAIEKGRFTDDRDGQSYETVKIGKQVWMAKNLNYEIKNSAMKSYCYQDQDSNCTKYGRLYTWAAAMDSAGIWSQNGMGCGFTGNSCSPIYPVRGICPSGWHLPDTTEWKSLEESAGGINKAANRLKASSGWASCGYDGLDSYGFSALPAGIRKVDDFFETFGGRYKYVYECGRTFFWSSNESYLRFTDVAGKTTEGFFNAYSIELSSTLYKGFSYKYDALSVRCVKDDGSFVAYSSSSVKPTSSSAKSSSSLAKSSSSSAVKSSSSIVKGSLVDERDGQIYKTVTIGNQTWMAENLNFETDNSYCYNDTASYCAKYGRLYTWTATKKLCPNSWHLPDTTEWNALFINVGGMSWAGEKLKSASGWADNGNGVDAYGFSALPAGNRYYNIPSLSIKIGTRAFFWSSIENDGDNAYSIIFDDVNSSTVLNISEKVNAYSVRCIKD